MTLPLISCLMPTYNKCPYNQHLPEEALEAFLLQDYPNKELILWNDHPSQRIETDCPGVIVVNTPVRFNTLGEKLNAIAGLASGELLCRWDDDDISLSTRLSYTQRRLAETGANLYKSQDYFYQEKDRLSYSARKDVPVHGKAIFTREAFVQVGGHALMNSGQDIDLEQRIKRLDPSKYVTEMVGPKDTHFIYRWGQGSYHLSAVSQYYSDKMVGYREIASLPAQKGTFQLTPRFRADYNALADQIRQTGQPLLIPELARESFQHVIPSSARN